MEKGTVKWFNAAKGFGFIRRSTGEDVFLHFSEINLDGYRSLEEGTEVEFEVVAAVKGLMAKNVSSLDRAVEEETSPQSAPALDSDFFALTLCAGRVRLVSITRDGLNFIDESSNIHNILYVYSSETRAVEIATDELESLVNDRNTRESDLQNFFERNPDFIISDEYKAAHSRIILRREQSEPLKPDFVLEPVDQGQLCDLLDLKLPSARIFVMKARRQRYSSAVLEACAQLREYALYFDEDRNRRFVEERYGLRAYKPRMFVVIGRRGAVSPIELRKMELDSPGLNLKTYDEVLARAKAKLDAMNGNGLRR